MILSDIREFLLELNLDCDIFCGNMPDKPANNLTIFEYEGKSPEIGYYSSPGIQLFVRNSSFQDGYEIMYRAKKYLEKIGFEDEELAYGRIINETLYLKAEPVGSGINQLGKDENGYHLFSSNFYITKEDNVCQNRFRV